MNSNPTSSSRSAIVPFGPSTDLIRGAVDLLVLSVLRNSALTTSGIEDAIERYSDDRLIPRDQVVSQSIQRLRTSGLVKQRVHDREKGEYIYRLSTAGEREVISLQQAWLCVTHAATAVVHATLIRRWRPSVISRGVSVLPRTGRST